MLYRWLVLTRLVRGGARRSFVARRVRRPRRPRPRFPVTITAGNGKVTVSKQPDAHRLALADGDRVAVRDRRRQAGDRGRRPVRLPEERAEDDALGLHAERRGDRRRTSPTSSSSRTTRRASSSALGRLDIPVHPPRRRADASRAPTSRSASSGWSPGSAGRRRSVIARMKTQIARIVATRRRPGGGPHRLPRARPRTSTRRRRSTFIGKVYALLGLRNIADAADSAGTGLPAALGRVHRLVEPRPDRARRHASAAARSASTVAARPGWDRDQRRADGLDRAHRRLDRLALGAAARELLPRDVARRSRRLSSQ